jgi:chemotaxis protein MotA
VNDLDIATLGGLIAGVVFIVVSILLNGELGTFADLPSVMITIGGAFSATLIAHPMDKFVNSLKSVSLVFKNQTMNEGEVIGKIIELSNVARKEGLLALEEATESIQDDFLKKGILLIVDGTDPELVRNILETELAFIQGRHNSVKAFWEKLGELGPAWGMIGTLIGLVNMLKKLDDPSAIGPSMAVALLTTMYGSILANLFCVPFANKLGIRNSEEVLLKEVMIEGLLSIQAGENPRVIEEKLKAFLSPTLRNNILPGDGEGAEE